MRLFAVLFFMVSVGWLTIIGRPVFADTGSGRLYDMLSIIPVCEDAETQKITWDITNTNSFPIPYLWDHYASGTMANEEAVPGTTRIYTSYTRNDLDGNLTGFQSRHPSNPWMDYSVRLSPINEACERNETILHNCVSGLDAADLVFSETSPSALAFGTPDGRPLCDDAVFTLSTYALPDELNTDGTARNLLPHEAYDMVTSRGTKAKSFVTEMGVMMPEKCRNVQLLLTVKAEDQTNILKEKILPGQGTCSDGTVPCRSNCQQPAALLEPEAVQFTTHNTPQADSPSDVSRPYSSSSNAVLAATTKPALASSTQGMVIPATGPTRYLSYLLPLIMGLLTYGIVSLFSLFRSEIKNTAR